MHYLIYQARQNHCHIVPEEFYISFMTFHALVNANFFFILEKAHTYVEDPAKSTFPNKGKVLIGRCDMTR